MRFAHDSGCSLSNAPSSVVIGAPARTGGRPSRRAAGLREDRYGTRDQSPRGNGETSDLAAGCVNRCDRTESVKDRAKERYSAASCRASGEEIRSRSRSRCRAAGCARSAAPRSAASGRGDAWRRRSIVAETLIASRSVADSGVRGQLSDCVWTGEIRTQTARQSATRWYLPLHVEICGRPCPHAQISTNRSNSCKRNKLMSTSKILNLPREHARYDESRKQKTGRMASTNSTTT